MLITSWIVFSGPAEVLAADTSGEWRPVYDLIMMWLNFGILVFLLIKFTKTPIVNFFKGQKEEVERDLHEAEQKQQAAQAKIAKTQKLLDESDTRLKTLKERILKQGEHKKQEIIANAVEESRILLEDARKRVDSQIVVARNKFRSELIDAAVDAAMVKLPGQVTKDDDRKMIEQYINKVG
ncbi:ATP synthase F0 subunit B [Desulfococcaceae bacterium HSG7]|nr:ATP synthase F0 subunit B [Desulfococcaceae bacterium HSG9]MDM8555697.1 ATP synthase F0 subunit B [Desulfococcaceae bacterium HSG7]